MGIAFDLYRPECADSHGLSKPVPAEEANPLPRGTSEPLLYSWFRGSVIEIFHARSSEDAGY